MILTKTIILHISETRANDEDIPVFRGRLLNNCIYLQCCLHEPGVG